MPGLLSIALDWRTWLAAVFVLLAGTAGVQTVRLSNAQAALATEQKERSEAKAKAEADARKMAENNARLQAEHAAKQQATLKAFNDALREQEIRAAAAAADAASLRDAVECYAAGRCLGANADAASGGTCQHRSATLGNLFNRANAAAGRMAKAADKHADEVRALKAQIETDRQACGASHD